MAAITVTKDNEAAGIGNLPVKTATCASIADGDTWETGLGGVSQLFVGGMTEPQAVTWTASGGTVTFAVTAGPLLNVDLMAIGSSM